MYKCMIVIALMFLALNLYPQEQKMVTPDFVKIEAEIKNENSNFYYPKLFERYLKGDTTLTVEDYHYLYFGHSFRDEHNPYFTHDSMTAFVKIFNKDSELTKEEYTHIIKLGNEILEKDPLNIRILKMVSYSYHMTGNGEKAWTVGTKQVRLLEAILNTGDGRTDSTAFYVICVSDEYEIIKFLRCQYTGQQALAASKGHSLDAMTILNQDKEKKTMYFNVDRPFAGMNKMFKK